MRVSKGIHVFLSLDLHKSKSALLIPKTEDGRVLFAVPWFDRLLVGTTETEVSTDDEMSVTKEEIAYVLRHLNHYLETPVSAEQIVSGTAGMRPLVSTSNARATSKLARDHEVELDEKSGLISIMGGKWTTYRAMAEDTINQVEKRLGKAAAPSRTKDHLLAGGEQYTPDYAKSLVTKFGISEDVAEHLALKFGVRATAVLELVSQDPELGRPIVRGFAPIRAEVIYSVREEMAMTIEDVLARRTGLELLDWRAAREAAALTGSLIARELGWGAERTKSEVENYRDRITRLLAIAGLPGERKTA
jgi:glycerol-3-phosphate dehydrogenase